MHDECRHAGAAEVPRRPAPRSAAAARPGERSTSLRKLRAGADDTRTVVLLLHGGRSRSTDPTRPWQLAYQRMAALAHAVHRTSTDAAVWLLRNRLRGWNEPRQDPVLDARSALNRVRHEHPEADIVLVGHSMGARAALRLAGEESVTAVCALAPWIEPEEPIEQLTGRSVLVAHGDDDRVTSAKASAEYVARAQRARHDIRLMSVNRSGHAMLRRSGAWTGLVREFVGDAVSAGVEQDRRTTKEGDR